MFRIVSMVLRGHSPVGTGTNVRIQFAPSPAVPRLTAMTRGAPPGGGLGGDLPKTMAAATPAKTTTIPTTRTTTRRVKFSDAGGGDGSDIIARGAGGGPGERPW